MRKSPPSSPSHGIRAPRGLLHVFDVERDVTESVGNNPLRLIALTRELAFAEHFHHGPLRIRKRDQSRNRRLRVALARGPDALLGNLTLETVEIGIGRELEGDAGAARLAAVP